MLLHSHEDLRTASGVWLPPQPDRSVLCRWRADRALAAAYAGAERQQLQTTSAQCQQERRHAVHRLPDDRISGFPCAPHFPRPQPYWHRQARSSRACREHEPHEVAVTRGVRPDEAHQAGPAEAPRTGRTQRAALSSHLCARAAGRGETCERRAAALQRRSRFTGFWTGVAHCEPRQQQYREESLSCYVAGKAEKGMFSSPVIGW